MIEFILCEEREVRLLPKEVLLKDLKQGGIAQTQTNKFWVLKQKDSCLILVGPATTQLAFPLIVDLEATTATARVLAPGQAIGLRLYTPTPEETALAARYGGDSI